MSKKNKNIYTIIRELMAKGISREEATHEAERLKNANRNSETSGIGKKPKEKLGQLSKEQKAIFEENSKEEVNKIKTESMFLNFVEKFTRNYDYLLEDRIVLEGTGQRGKYPKIDINNAEQRELYDRFTLFVEKVKNFRGLTEKSSIKNALRNGQFSEIERNILQHRLDIIDSRANIDISK